MEVPDDWDVHNFGLVLASERANAIRNAMMMGLQREDAEDAVSRASLELLTRCAQGRVAHIHHVPSYFATAVRNAVYNHYRDAARRGRLFEALNASKPPFDREERDPSAEAVLFDLLRHIERSHASAFLLVEFYKFTQEEAAKLLGCAQSTISTYLDRARDTLQAQLGEEPV